MIIEIPDTPFGEQFTPEELQLELACALYARGRIGKVAATKMAGVDFFAFQRALGERRISMITEKMLDENLETLKKLFPES